MIDLDYEPITIIRREILPSGKSRAFVNDTPVKLDSLQILGSRLLDIHSQHQTLQLTNDDFQFKIIDALANNASILSNYAEALTKYRHAENKLKGLKAQKAESLKELDYKRFLLQELNEAQLKSGELEALESEYDTLNNVEDIKERLAISHQRLTNEEMGIISGLADIKQQLGRVTEFGKTYNELYERIDSSLIDQQS